MFAAGASPSPMDFNGIGRSFMDKKPTPVEKSTGVGFQG